MGLDRAIETIGPDELVEATPKNIRMRKRILDSNLRRREEKRGNSKGVARHSRNQGERT
jgi:predicted membrane GTPase involved in stress response